MNDPRTDASALDPTTGPADTPADAATPESTFDLIRFRTTVVDISDDPGWMAAAHWEIALAYANLATPARNASLRDVHDAICHDGYDRDGRSRMLATITTDPDTGVQELSAVVRLVLGSTHVEGSDLPPIDAMKFVVPRTEWPHRLRGMTDREAAELTRFTVMKKYRAPEMRRAGVDAYLTATLVDAGIRLAGRSGVRIMYCIALPNIEIATRGGVRLTDIPIDLRTDDAEAAAVFADFAPYWSQSPKLFIMENFERLVEPFLPVLGPDAMVADFGSMHARYGRNVTALDRRVHVALRPGTEDEVLRIVAIANAQRIPLYPFSTGKNWGLGSKLPVVDDCVLVDLSRMTRIVEVNEEFGYAILEPGVTQLQLATHLNAHHPSLTLNFTGSFAYTGIVGNVLERGDGAHARVDDLLGVRGVLGNGAPFAVGGIWDRVGTGFPSHVSRFTAGPDLCGLFCQSNFGITTQLAFKLIHKPERRYVVWGSLSDATLPAFVDAVRRFTAQGVVDPGSVNIGYANRFVQARGTMAGEAAGVPAAEEWNYYVFIGGTPASTDALAEEIRTALRPHSISSGAFRLGRDPGDHDPPAGLPPFLQPLLAPLLGMPDASSIRMIYQLTGTPFPANDSDLDADQTPFGMKCCIAVVPPGGRYVRQAVDIVASVRRRHPLNIKASFFGDGRTLITIHFRTDDPAQVAEAEGGERALWDDMVGAGFHPYRVSIDQMERLVALDPGFFAIVRALKSALDPNGIIAPGRYCPLT